MDLVVKKSYFCFFCCNFADKEVTSQTAEAQQNDEETDKPQVGVNMVTAQKACNCILLKSEWSSKQTNHLTKTMYIPVQKIHKIRLIESN